MEFQTDTVLVEPIREEQEYGGQQMRVALGIALFSGMLGVTIFGIFFTPVFYNVIRWFAERGSPSPAVAKKPSADLGAAGAER